MASDSQALEDAELADERGVTYAALVLLGTRKALGRHLPNAEVAFEYRSSAASGPANQRIDFRQGFFGFYDSLWQAISARNDFQHYQDGLFVWDVPTFQEKVVREAVLNAVAHRDYRNPGSVFICQYPRSLVVTSPGGLPAGVTVDNIYWKHLSRNRRICDAFQLCGLVERSGQGMNTIVEESIRDGKQLPDFTGTDDHQVSLILNGLVNDPKLITFLSKVGQERLASFATQHFLVVDLVHRGKPVPEGLRQALAGLLEQQIVERVGPRRLVLSKRFYEYLGEKGTYTRKIGLDRGTNKALLLKHLQLNATEGSRMEELLQVLPGLSRHQIARLLVELRSEGAVHVTGTRRNSRWFPGTSG